MTVVLRDVLSNTLSFLQEANDTLRVKSDIVPESNELELFTYLVADLGFQVDFCLISSITQIQEIYDGYRNKQVEESNIQIRTLLNLATHIHNTLTDENLTGWVELIERLTSVLTLHSNVDHKLSCQDESILDCMSAKDWKTALTHNPWLVAAVCIQQLPAYYILQLTSNIEVGDSDEP